MAGFNSFHLIPEIIVRGLLVLDTILLAMAAGGTSAWDHSRQCYPPGRYPADADGAGAVHWLIGGGAAINLLIPMITG